MIKIRKKKENKMKKLLYILFILSISLDNISYAESNLEKIKNKIKTHENKLIGKVWGDKDCSQYSTKNFKGLYNYKKCKDGLDPTKDKSIFSWKKSVKFDPNKPCVDYSTKTFTGLAAKMKCKRAKKE